MKSFELTPEELTRYRDAVSRDDQAQRDFPMRIPTGALEAMNGVLKARGVKGEAVSITIQFADPFNIYSLRYLELTP